jgi:hypothetical protein
MDIDQIDSYDRHMMLEEYKKDLKAYQIYTTMILMSQHVEMKDS